MQRNLAERPSSVDLIEQAQLRRIDLQHKIRMLVRLVQQDRHSASGNAVSITHGPRRANGNISTPLLATELNGLFALCSITAISNKLVLRNRSSKEFDGRMLRAFRQLVEHRRMRRPCQYPALWKIWGLLNPASERHPASVEPCVNLGHTERTIFGVKDGICQRVGMFVVFVLTQQMRHWMICW